jgi:sigma-E factor negative regulatory protein RseA
MKQKLHEQLSALVDDELASAEHALLLKRLAQDAALRQRLARYQLVSDGLRNHLPGYVDAGFHHRVQAALQNEPVPQSGSGRLASLLRPLAGVAVAASVAVVAVLALQSVREQDLAAIPAVAVAPGSSDYIRAARAPQSVAGSGIAQGLDVYLVNHNEFAVNRGMQGMLPYVRLVGGEANIESTD